ncbi:hypothetical protein [Streptomyces sp. NRRL S-350]|uniref:hypothetical protein n=1 Tax=Streptomyces sp. NRRL S-350 TaxID=1463902 RepID=UPI0018FF0C35|nr:hypothetical protein [Streptomyces sp. NRRL S-350]
MATPPVPRRRPGAVPVAALAGLLVLLTLAALALGSSTPGGLQDQGPVRTVTPPPVPQTLWPGLDASPAPTPPATGTGAGGTTQQPPQPVPGVTVPGQGVTALDLRAVLANDPAVSTEERLALGSCSGCEVRSPEFRDLTGDGRISLITAVITPGPVVLHVYTPAEDRLLPVLRVQVQRTFNAETIGSDLWLYESTGLYVRTSSHYQWDGARLVLLERKDEGLGVLPPTGPDPAQPDKATKSAAPAAPPAPPTATPSAGAAAPSPRAPRPPSQSSQPSAPAVSPEPKR